MFNVYEGYGIYRAGDSMSIKGVGYLEPGVQCLLGVWDI